MTAIRAVDIDLVKKSGLFDEAWYVEEYPDVQFLRMDPVEHYLVFGAKLGRNPSPKFDANAYLATNDDARAGGINPLLHYLALQRKNHVQSWKGQAKSSAPAIVLEPARPARLPHYGPTFHRLVQEVCGRKKPVNAAKEYDAIRNEFDIAYYLMRHPDIAQAVVQNAGFTPVQHYINHGAKEGRNPSPDFSTKHYVERYPDVQASGVNPFYHWVTSGRKEGRIAEGFSEFEGLCSILGRSPEEVQEMLVARRRDLRERLERGVLGEMVKKAAELEPLIAHSWREAFTVRLPPFHSDDLVKMVVGMYRLQEAVSFQQAKAVVVIPHCRLSGATRVAGHLANALAEIYGAEELVVLRTDLDVMEFPEWFPPGCRHAGLPGVADKLPAVAREKLLVEFLRSLRPEAVFNVNSRLFWDALHSYGKALSASMALYAYFFCNDKNHLGQWNGYPLQKFYRYFDILSGVITDSHLLAEELRGRHLVPPDQAARIVTLETPVAVPPAAAVMPPARAGRRPQIFWSGRFDRQKRVDIVLALATRLPEADFRLWGEPVLDRGVDMSAKSPNVSLEGRYRDYSELPFESCDLYLYTSEWDGVPNILIEVAARGVPLVGSLTGGTGEILQEGLSWSVADIEDIGAYEAGVRAVLADPGAARERALRLRERVLSRRTPVVYRNTLETLLSGRPST